MNVFEIIIIIIRANMPNLDIQTSLLKSKPVANRQELRFTDNKKPLEQSKSSKRWLNCSPDKT